jgi:methenyltetrahydrofolate cyclohydrolase
VGAEADPAYAEQPLGRFLELVASRQPAPGGGAAAAIGVALAAGLAAMVARFSAELFREASHMAGQADGLRLRAAELAQADSLAYQRVINARREARADADRRHGVRTAFSAAADVPCEIARVGATVAELAARLAQRGNPNLRGDAVTAALLAEAGVRAAAELVALNLRSAAIEDGRDRECSGLVDLASAAARRALSAARRDRSSEKETGGGLSARPS